MGRASGARVSKPLDWLWTVSAYERTIRAVVGADSDVWWMDHELCAVRNVDGSTQIVAHVSVTRGDPDSVIRALQALAVLVGADTQAAEVAS